MIKRLRQKSIALILIALTLLPAALVYSIYPRKVSAQFVPVQDAFLISTVNANAAADAIIQTQTAIATAGQTIKEVGPGPFPLATELYNPTTAPILALGSLDGLYVHAIKEFVQDFTVEIVDWIDEGFPNEGPAFVKDPGSFFLDIGDSIAGHFIESIPELEFLCDPFKLELDANLLFSYQSYTFEKRSTCRLSEVISNIENFEVYVGDSALGQSADFLIGGWDGWISLAEQNQYSSFLEARAMMSATIAGRKNTELAQLEWGNGFLSFQDCLEPAGAPLSECIVKGPIESPGKVIQDGLSDVLGTDLRQFELADSFDAIIAATINQLFDSFMSDFLGG